MDEKINILEILSENLGKPQIDSAAWHTPEYCKAICSRIERQGVMRG